MAITLNGSNNTIGGLANGGLPDGCILDADINGMAASKLSGALPAISGAALTGVSGGLVSFKHAPISAYQVIQSTSLTLTNLQITYTPVDGANNRVYVLMTGNFEFDGNDNNHHQFIIKCTGQHTTDLPLTSQRVGSDISSVPNTTSLSMLLRDPNITGNAAITYRAGVYCEDVTNSQHRMRNNLALTVFEIDPSANQN
tara:strand:- start:257 stop:853 length:597 start_codon:yes stop_codon:yes gene_type:complete